MFLTAGAWHPLTMLGAWPARILAGVITGCSLARWPFARQQTMVGVVAGALVMALPSDVALLACSIVLLLAALRWVTTGSRVRIAAAVVVLTLAVLATGGGTVWVVAVSTLAGATWVIGDARDRSIAFVRLVVSIVLSMLVSAPWWLPALTLRGERPVAWALSPPFFFPRAIVVRADRDEAVATVRRLTDVRDLATIDQVPPKVVHRSAGRIASHEGALIAGSGGALRARANGVEVVSTGWNLLVSNKPFWPGWRAYWNGQRMPPVRADGAFVGLFVPPGRGVIRLRYHPDAFDVGLRLAAAGLLLLLPLCAWSWDEHARRALLAAVRLARVAGAHARLPSLAQARLALPILLLIAYAAVLARHRVDVASSADASGYLNQARLWSNGSLIVPLELASRLRLPHGLEDVTIPLGFIPGRQPFTMVPTYPPGMPMLLALLRAAGGEQAQFFLGPLAAAAAVLLLYRLARSLELPATWSFAAATFLAICPVFVFHGIQVMSDDLATCCGLAAVVCAFRSAGSPRFAALAGACAGFGVLVRPTQVLLVPALLLAIGLRKRALAVFAAAIVPFALVQLTLNAHLYGNPLASGYGSVLGDLRLANFPPRFAHYGYWLAVMLSPVIFPLGLLGLRAREAPARVRLVLAVWWIPSLLFYCLYGPYETWWYTRFLLPAAPALILTTVFWLRRSRPLALAGVTVALVVQLMAGRHFDVLNFAQGERLYRTSAEAAGAVVPERDVLVTMQHSGALYYYTGRTSLRYDRMTPGLFNAIRITARADGRQLYALAGSWEVAELTARTGISWLPLRNVDGVLLLRPGT